MKTENQKTKELRLLELLEKLNKDKISLDHAMDGIIDLYATLPAQSSDAVEFEELIKHNEIQSFMSWFEYSDTSFHDTIEESLKQFSIFLKEKGAQS